MCRNSAAESNIATAPFIQSLTGVSREDLVTPTSPEVQRVIDFTSDLYCLETRFWQHNEGRRFRTRKVLRLQAMAHSIHFLANLVNNTPQHMGGPTPAAAALEQKARDFRDAIMRELPVLDPVPEFDPSFHSEHDRLVRRLFSMLRERSNIEAVRTLANHQATPSALRIQVLRLAYDQAVRTLSAAEATPAQRQIAEHIRMTIANDDIDVTGAARSGLDALTSHALEPAFVDSIAILARRRLVDANMGSISADQLIGELGRHAYLRTEEIDALRQAARTGREEHRQAAIHEVTENARPSVVITAISTTLSWLTMLKALEDARPSDTPPFMWRLEQIRDVASAGQGTLALVHALGSRAYALRTSEVTAALQFSRDLVSHSSKAVSGLASVISIINGWREIETGRERGDQDRVISGGIELASGLLVMAGLFVTVPGAQPISAFLTLLGAVGSLESYVRERDRPYNQKIALFLVERLRSENEGSFERLARGRLDSLLNDLESAIRGQTTWSVIAPGPSSGYASQMRQTRRAIAQGAREALRVGGGFAAEDVARMAPDPLY